MTPCPCGSGKDFDACCGRYIAGVAAPTAEALMRSRYSAYATGATDYIARTYAPETRPPGGAQMDGTEWVGLEILKTARGGETDETGTVEFVARFRQGGQVHQLHEISNFRREDGQWVYVDGVFPDTPVAPKKVGRNDPCPCGSGKKYKKCCGK